MMLLYFYPRSPCGERPCENYRACDARWISIHALLAESDSQYILKGGRGSLFLSTLSLRRATLPQPLALHNGHNFYPRSPCGERPVPYHNRRPQQPFLSTLSLRRATYGDDGCHDLPRDFYPRSPCGERLCSLEFLQLRRYFYPRSPCGERPERPFHCFLFAGISIHALLAESDRCRCACRC